MPESGLTSYDDLQLFIDAGNELTRNDADFARVFIGSVVAELQPIDLDKTDDVC
jgi:hypothetical protein